MSRVSLCCYKWLRNRSEQIKIDFFFELFCLSLNKKIFNQQRYWKKILVTLDNHGHNSFWTEQFSSSLKASIDPIWIESNSRLCIDRYIDSKDRTMSHSSIAQGQYRPCIFLWLEDQSSSILLQFYKVGNKSDTFSKNNSFYLSFIRSFLPSIIIPNLRGAFFFKFLYNKTKHRVWIHITRSHR